MTQKQSKAASAGSAPLEHVVLASNPHQGSGWAGRTGQAPVDIATIGAAQPGGWSVACNLARIGLGTMAWIARYQGAGVPVLAGFFVVDDDPYEDPSDGEWYVSGTLCGWSERLWVPGEEIASAGWSANQAPFGGGPVQFQNGRKVMPGDEDALVAALDPLVLDYIGMQFEHINGYWPAWA